MTTCRAAFSSRYLWCFFVAALTAAVAQPAHAQAEDQAAARALFAEGRQLMKKGEYAAACRKLEAARALYTSAGTLLNLADCYEHLGRIASAWTEFGEAATVADRSNRPQDGTEARRRQGALEPSLGHLTVQVADAVPGLVLKRDGVTLTEAAWGSALPVDAGKHTVTAEAPGYEPWSTSVTAADRTGSTTVQIPLLRAVAVALPLKQPVTPPAQSSADAAPRSVSHALAWTLTGVGAGLAAGGGMLMIIESLRAQDARDAHDNQKYDATRTPWTIGLVGAIAGAAAVVTGLVLLATAPHDGEPPAASLSAWIQPGTGGVRLFGSW
jgi:tetratricopeptide (TPR) repeat protein